MNNLLKFLLFIFYSSIIFFLPNNNIIFLFIFINILFIIINFKNFNRIVSGTIKFLPFIIFTFIFNCIFDNLLNALWISFKLIIVCNITILYSCTTSVLGVSDTIQLLCTPLKIFNIDTNDIKLMVCISLSMIPILQNDLYEVKNACISKNMKLNITNMKYLLSKFLLTLLKRVNSIEESLSTK